MQAENGQGQADEIIKVSRRLQPRRFTLQNGGKHLFGGGLTRRTGNRDQRPPQLHTNHGRNIAKGAQAVGNQQHRHTEPGYDLFTQTGGRSVSHRLNQIVMAVKAHPAQGDKQFPRTDISAVGRNTIDFHPPEIGRRRTTNDAGNHVEFEIHRTFPSADSR